MLFPVFPKRSCRVSGIIADLVHILERSGVGAEIDVERVPVAAGADLEAALCGGEDYKLLLTACGEGAETLRRDFEAHFRRPLYPVGRIVASADPLVRWLRCGRPFAADWHGFRHY